MRHLADFAITRRWPPRDPQRIQLYSWSTPNGVKASIMLEETGLPYEAHAVRLADEQQKSPEFLELNPYGKIPAMIDPDGPDGALGLFESGAILLYLAEKSGQLLPVNPAARHEAVQWLMFQVAGIGPMFGQLGFFHFHAGREYEDKRPRDRYVQEVRRLLAVLEQRLRAGAWLLGEDYSIVDIATFPWVRTLVGTYAASELVGMGDFPHVRQGLDAFLARPAVQRGLRIPPRE